MTLLDRFLGRLVAQENFPYVWPDEANHWSGKGLAHCLYPTGRDCSGTTTFPLWEVAPELDRRATYSADRIWREYPGTKTPQAGDHALYGANGKVTHIMTLMPDGRVFGACGGGSGTLHPTPGAYVMYRQGPFYRKDCVGFVVNPLRVLP